MESHKERLMAPDFLGHLQRAAWPGNVRELKNYLERCVVFEEAVPPPASDAPLDATGEIRIDTAPDLERDRRAARETGSQPVGKGAAVLAIDLDLPLQDARKLAVEEFERRYLSGLLERHEGRVAQAATAAGIDRVYMYKLLRRYKLK
jgi:two-component system response regulator GlrR